MTFSGGFPIAEHFDEVEEAHIGNAVQPVLWVMCVVGVVMAEADIHGVKETFVFWGAVSASLELRRELIEALFLWGL